MKRNGFAGRIITRILTITMLVFAGVILRPEQVRAVDNVPYIDPTKTPTAQTADGVTVLNSDTTGLHTGWGSEGTTKWYAVTENISVTGRIIIQGTVNLILYDEKTLTAVGGITTTGATLNIYAQSEGTGKLYAGTTNGVDSTAEDKSAGIGGNESISGNIGGNLTINGGTIIATGGHSGAGIGGGIAGTCEDVTINGGTVIATGGTHGAGIGGGSGASGGSITINGGSVTATGSWDAEGIGKGSYIGNSGSITLGTNVKLYTRSYNSDWSDSTETLTRTQYMKALIPVSYMKWDDTNKKLVPATTGTTEYTTVTDQTTWGQTGTETWYVVNDNITIDGRINVNGTVNLILCEDTTLTASSGINVQDNDNDPTNGSLNTLNIYGQSLGTGALTIQNCGVRNAGIGSGEDQVGGNITINGGAVNVTGGFSGAGIGGGNKGAGGNITINGGAVNATGGSSAAGIGGGMDGAGGSITINGGTVTANGGAIGGAGIGGGCVGEGGTICINGGTVVATGGYGNNNACGDAGAGIGGGAGKTGGNITINGGSVTATGGNDNVDVVGIGGGGADLPIDHGTLTLGTGIYVYAKDNGAPETTGTPLAVDNDRKVTGDRQKYMKSVSQYAVTFKVVHGSWDDDTNTDKIVRLTRAVNEDLALHLTASDIPSVGSKPAGGYKEGSWDVEPTTEIAINEDKTYTYTYTTNHVHSFTGHVSTPATCTETGVMTYTCSCGASYTGTIPALGHDYVGTITKYASTQEDGIMTYTCSRCHDSYTEVIPKHEPTLEEGIEMIKQLISELEGDEEHKVEVNVNTEKKDDGTTETVVTVGDEEILKITTDEDGEEEIESNIWSIGGDGNFTYTGAAIKPEILVFDGLKRLSLGSDFTVSYKNNVNAGAKAEAKVEFRGGYSETSAIKTNFTIDPADLGKNATAPTMIIASTGKTQKPIPEITITESGKSLGKSDLEYKYLDSEKKEVSVIKDAGDYTVEAVPKKTGGNLTGKITVPITVNGDKTKLLSNGKINLAKKSYVYTGKPIIPDKDTYSLTIDGTKLTEGKDYTLTVSKNIEPGKATMIFTAADGNEDGYVGSIKAVFTITKGKELKPAGDGSDFKYTYEENAPFAKGGAKPEVIVMDGDHVLTKDEDYKVSYDKNKKITEGKTAVMQVSGKGIYKGKVTLYYAVVPQDIAALAGGIEVQDKAVSNKGYKNPKVTITDENGKTLSKNNDYEFVDDYTEPDKDGNVTVTIKGKGAYTGTVPVTYRYLEAAALIDKVNASKIADKTYTGSPIRLTKKEAEKLLYTGKGKNINYLTWGEDFEIVRYENNTKPGTAKVILRGIGTHGGTRTVTFKIKSAKKTGLKIIISKLFNK